MRRKGLLILLSCICLVLLVAACAKPAPTPAPAPMPAEVSIGTHAVGTSFYSCGVGFAKVISDHSQLKMVAKPFAGPGGWMPLVLRGDVHMGYISLCEAVWAYAGDPAYAVDAPELRLMVRMNWITAMMGLVVREDSGIKKAADLRGKRVASDYGGSVMCHRAAEMFLRLGGVTWDDVVKVPVPGFVEGLKALQEGRVDACFAGSPVTAKTREVDAAIKIRPLPFEKPADWQKIVSEIVATAEPYMGKAGFGILREDVLLIKHPAGVVTSSMVSEEVVKEITKVLWEHYVEFDPIHPWLAQCEPELMFNPSPLLPYHSGVVSWFKEKGLWTAELEQTQEQLLKLRGQK